MKFYFVIKLVWLLACLRHYLYFYGREKFPVVFDHFCTYLSLFVLSVGRGGTEEGSLIRKQLFLSQNTQPLDQVYCLYSPTRD